MVASSVFSVRRSLVVFAVDERVVSSFSAVLMREVVAGIIQGLTWFELLG
jgi:hypothetical protein